MPYNMVQKYPKIKFISIWGIRFWWETEYLQFTVCNDYFFWFADCALFFEIGDSFSLVSSRNICKIEKFQFSLRKKPIAISYHKFRNHFTREVTFNFYFRSEIIQSVISRQELIREFEPFSTLCIITMNIWDRL